MASGMLIAQFSTCNDPTSDAIRWATNGEYSHVDIVLPEGLLGAHEHGGVETRPPNYANFTKVKIVQAELPDIDAALAFARAQKGKPYNIIAILDMVLHRTRPFVLNQPAWFCDELLYAVALVGGVQLLNTDNPLTLTPEEVALSTLWKEI